MSTALWHTTCDELAEIWIDRFPRPRPTTNDLCRRMVKGFGRDFAYRLPGSIDREEARTWGLANPTHVRFVRTMFNDLVGDGVIEENVFAALGISKEGVKRTKAPSADQVFGLINAAREDGNMGLASRIKFAAFVGLRGGEQRAVLGPALGRAPAGNPLISGQTRLDIVCQMHQDGTIGEPKTPRSTREAFVPAIARRAVAEADAARRDSDSPYLWPEPPRLQKSEWQKLQKDTGIWIRWHDLRHFCATWLLNQGATVDDVAATLGCKAEEIRDRYGHPERKLALGRLERLVEGDDG